MGILIDPGYYTKLRLDQNGNIQDADYLAAEDLPDHTHSVDELTGDFQAKVISCLQTFFANSKDNAVVFTFDKETGTVSADVRIDGYTITRNEDGELQAEGGDGSGSSVSSECATHTHTTSQIEDFEDAVKEIIGAENSKLSIDDLSDLIDNSTIIINTKGQLSAVGTAVAEHTHYLKDIVDYVAPKAAALQPMSDLGDDVDYSGAVEIKNLSLGYSIVALNYYVKNVTEARIDNLQKEISKIARTASNENAVASFKVDPTSMHNILTEVASGKARDVYYAPDLRFILECVPYPYSTIILVVDGEEKDSCGAENVALKGQSEGIFACNSVLKKGETSSAILTISNLTLSEGKHTLQLKYDLGDDTYDYSESITVYVTNIEEMEISAIDKNPTHSLMGKTYYDAPYEGLWSLYIKNIKELTYANFESGFNSAGLLQIEDDEYDYKIIENLFYTTKVSFTRSYEEESSSSDIFNNVVSATGEIVNDTLSSVNGNEVAVCFRIPRSSRYNTIVLYGLDEDASATLIKGDAEVSSSQAYIEFEQSGKIENDDGVEITLKEDYDDGKSNLEVILKTKGSLNFNEISWELLNL